MRGLNNTGNSAFLTINNASAHAHKLHSSIEPSVNNMSVTALLILLTAIGGGEFGRATFQSRSWHALYIRSALTTCSVSMTCY